jgi:2-succinyl-5-enolpyruvyl-6-hydroxy-3-cyclohexene-1-carboxylate synthase
MSASDLHSAWARLFLSSLASAGLRELVISPGSRSTPLALAAAREPRLRLHVLIDERDAAFFALGQARRSGAPSALLCTSGTAGAHYLPAIIEAGQSHVPLLVITADRPWDAYDAASAQTIDQVKLYGDAVRHYAELGLPDPSPSALAAVVRIAAQALCATRAPRPGPVHINARFRKPLEPVQVPHREPFADRIDELLARGAPRVFPARPACADAAIDAAAALCTEHERGLLVCGPAWAGTDAGRLRLAVAALARVTGFPIWAEAVSGVRFGGVADGGFDALLRSAGFRRAHPPELIIELGGPPVSTAYASYLAEHAGCRRAVIAAHGWNDPGGTASLLCFGDPAELCERLATHPKLASRAPAPTEWARSLRAAEALVWRCAESERDPLVLSEGEVARAAVEALPAGATLVVGNSLPVRDLDTFCPPGGRPLRVLHQRGASGIDGLIAGAAGARSVGEEPLLLLLGDLSALHDLGGFAALRGVPGPLVVVIVQNRGGRIFEQLPVAKAPAVQPDFERLFVTPQDVDFAAAAQAFGLGFSRATSGAELRSALAAALRAEAPVVIEAVVPPQDGAARRARLWQRIARALDEPAPSAEAGAPVIPRVFYHGFLSGPAQWRALVSRTAGPASCEYLPGHGPAPRVLEGAGFFDVVDALAAALPAPRCELVGYSLGGRLALALALRHPERVAALTLISADPGLRSEADRAARIAWEEELAARAETAPLPAFVDAWESLPLFATQQRVAESELRAQRQQRLEHVGSGIAWVLRTLGTGRMPELWSQLHLLRAPVRVITGALDEKFTRIGRELAEQVPGLRHAVLEGAGHNVVLEAPDALCALLSQPFNVSPSSS